MILHFITDDKFADYAIKQFTAPDMQSCFVLMIYGDEVRNVELKDKTTIVKANSADFTHLLTTLGKYSAIVLHGLFDPWAEEVLLKVPSNVKVAWMFWGGEIYGRRDVAKSFLSPSSQLLCWLHGLKKHDVSTFELPIELYQRIDYCLTDMEEEYDFVKRYTHSKMQHLWYNYYSIDETIGQLRNFVCHGEDVWLGNSATAENNHLMALYLLRHLRSRKLIAPLSYGNKWYKNVIVKIGRSLLKSSFVSLTTFLPRDQYNQLMLNCNTMVQAHYRPQAQGNIITGLWLGMRVYMSERSLAYQYFKRLGCFIYSLEKDFKTATEPYKPLSTGQIEHNRNILWKQYSKEIMLDKNIELVKVLSE